MKKLTDWQIFFTFALLGYLIVILILGFLPVINGSYIGNVSMFLRLSFLVFLFNLCVAYYLLGKRISTAATLNRAIFYGLTSAILVTALTPFFVNVLTSSGYIGIRSGVSRSPISISLESLLYALGGIAYGLVPSLLIGSCLGWTIYKRHHSRG